MGCRWSGGKAFATVVAFALAGCGGGSGPAAPPSVTSIGSNTSAVIGSGVMGKLSLTAANGVTSTSAAHRTVKFVSPGAMSAGISINGGTTVFADVSSTSALCTTAAGVRTCTISVGAPAGQQSFAVALYDAANGGGHLLGSGSNSTTVVAGTPFTVAVGVNPVVAALASLTHQNTFSLGSANSYTTTPTFGDAAGQLITGSGNVPNFLNPVTVTSSDPHITIQQPTLTTPGQGIDIIYDGSSAVASTINVTLTSNGATVYTNVISIPGLGIQRHGIGAINTVNPEQIIVGPDGNLWWAESSDNMVGRINPAPGNNPVHFNTGFTGTPHPFGIAAGADGNIWVNDGKCTVQRFSTAGAAVGPQIVVGTGCTLSNMAADNNGNVWYLDIGNSVVGELDFATQTPHNFSTVSPAALSGLSSIASGPDGAMYFTESAKRMIGRVTTSNSMAADGHPLGFVTEYPILNTSASIFPTGITAGPDGNLWFLVFDSPSGTNQFFAKFAPVPASPTIAITEYPGVIDPNAFANLVSLASGADGNIWIVQGGGAVKIPPANPTGALTELFNDNGQVDTHGVVKGPDGRMWFVGLGSAGGNGFIPTTDSVNSFAPR